MDNNTIGLLLVDIAMALGLYKLGGIPWAVGSLLGSAFYFLVLR